LVKIVQYLGELRNEVWQLAEYIVLFFMHQN
jgi:hypothetical protein